MHTFIKRALLGAFIGGGIAVLGAGVAHAADTTGDDGLLSGTQALLGVEAPLTIGGNAISLLGDSTSADADATPPAAAPALTANTSGKDGAGSGTQALVTVSAPVTVAGNGISVLGDSASTGAQTEAPAAPVAGVDPADAVTPTTSGDDAIAGGTQVIAPVTAPVTVGGNAVSVIGDSATDGSVTGSTGLDGTRPSGSEPITSGEDSILSGTQLSLPLVAPVTVGGNAVSVIGDSTTTEHITGPGTTNPGTTDPTDPGTTDPTDPGGTDEPTSPDTPGDGTDGAMVTGGLASVVGTPAGAALAQTGSTGDSVLLALALGVAAIAVGLGLRLGRTARSRH
jgi:hypothetical protein